MGPSCLPQGSCRDRIDLDAIFFIETLTLHKIANLLTITKNVPVRGLQIERERKVLID